MRFYLSLISLAATTARIRLSAVLTRQVVPWTITRSYVGIPIRLIDENGNYLTDENGNILTLGD